MRYFHRFQEQTDWQGQQGHFCSCQ
ncbi:hypothetical protein [Leptotrichia hofstadii]